MTDPWQYRLVWEPVSRATVIPHPRYALHRSLKSVGEHVRVLAHDGIRRVKLDHWENGDWWEVDLKGKARR